MNKLKVRHKFRARTNTASLLRTIVRPPMVEQCEPRVLLSTYTVNTISDSPKPGTKLLSLRQAVASANAHAGADTIQFASSVFGAGTLHRIVLTHGEIAFTDTSGATTIKGPGEAVVAVDAKKASRIFTIQAGATATISGLCITNGFAIGGGNGGGIFNAGTLTLKNDTVSNNAVDGNTATGTDTEDGIGRGGGIYSSGKLTLQNTNVSLNTAAGSGIFASPYLSILACGGGIFSSGPLAVSNSVISQNTVRVETFAGEGAGGGIYCTGPLSMTSSVVVTNTSIGGPEDVPAAGGGHGIGGGIYFGGHPSASIISSQITGNIAQGGPSAVGFDGDAKGGGIYALQLAVSACTISGNVATGGMFASGGGVYCGNLVIDQSTISGNTTVDKVALADKAARGGGLYCAGSLTATRSTISGNSAIGAKGVDATTAPSASGPGGTAAGGGVYFRSTADLTECTITGNRAVGGAGGSGLRSGIIVEAAAHGGDAQGGGFADVNSRYASLHLFNTTVTGNVALGGAGGSAPPLMPAGKVGSASAGGIDSKFDALLQNSIVSANTAGGAFDDIVGPVESSSSFNLIGVGGGLANGANGNKVGVTDPKLQPLANYGGATQTMLPMAASPAINAGNNALIPSGTTVDQRGMPRVFGSSVDIGADEYIALTLTGTVYNDQNADGVRQSTEKPLARWKVYIDLNNTGVFASGDPSALSNSKGVYRISYLPTSLQPLTVREVLQNSFRRTQPAAPDPLGIYTVSPTAASVGHLDFGNTTTALISGTVFNDANANGLFDATEHGVSGFRVYVDLNHDGKFESNEASAISDASGNWSIAGLAAGSYIVRVALPLAVRLTTPAGGVLSIILSAGQFVSGKLFGETSIHKIP